MKIVVLGCGYHGRGIAYEIAAAEGVEAVVVADRDGVRARAVAEKAGAAWQELDVRNRSALAGLLEGATLVFNAVGPYHRTAIGVIETAMDAGVHYADMCDDHEVAETLFLDPVWNERAQAAGVSILIGCGIAPGISAMLAQHGCTRLDSADRVGISFSWNYYLEYPAALHHFLRISSGLAPQFIDGAFVRPGPLAGHEIAEFLDPVGTREVFYTGIIDPVSIPCSLPGLREVTAKGSFLQPEANEFLEAMVRWGMTSYQPVDKGGPTPFDFLMSYVTSAAGRDVFDIAPLPLPMPVRVEVEGTSDGQARRLRYEAHDYSRRGTTVPAARAALMVARREVDFTGVRAPEGCIDAAAFLGELQTEPDIRLFAWEDGEEPGPLVP